VHRNTGAVGRPNKSLQPSADAWAVVARGEAKTYAAGDNFMWADSSCYCEYAIVAVAGGLETSRPPSRRLGRLFALQASSAGNVLGPGRRATVLPRSYTSNRRTYCLHGLPVACQSEDGRLETCQQVARERKVETTRFGRCSSDEGVAYASIAQTSSVQRPLGRCVGRTRIPTIVHQWITRR
jgi:hypothetical protein